MADYTTNFNLEKPLINEYYDVDVQNRNMDVIDGELNNINTRTANLESNKVDRIDGKSLSTEDYTTLEKSKLFGIDDGANNYVHPSSHPAAMVTIADIGNNFTSTSVEGALSELFTSVSNGKQQIATAITDVDNNLSPSGSDTFTELSNTIRNISTGKKFVSGTLISDKNFNKMNFTVSTLTFQPSTVLIKYHGQKSSEYSGTNDEIDSFAFRFPNGNIYGYKKAVAWTIGGRNIYNYVKTNSGITFLSNGFSVTNFDVYGTSSTIYWIAYE